MTNENKRYALVTGGSRGIGRAICKRLAMAGYDILINYVSNKEAALEAKELVEAEGRTAEILQFDVADNVATKAELGKWQAEHKGEYISVIINNAGIRKDNLMMWIPEEDWNSVIQTSLSGFYNVTQPLLKNMLVKKWGRIVNIVSVSGLKGMPGQTNYSAAKGGMIAATKALAQEVAKKNVTVNAVAPGFIKSDMTEGIDEQQLKKFIPMGRFGNPEEVASLVAFLVSEEASYITGDVISINGGVYT